MSSARLPQQALLAIHYIEIGFQLQAKQLPVRLLFLTKRWPGHGSGHT